MKSLVFYTDQSRRRLVGALLGTGSLVTALLVACSAPDPSARVVFNGPSFTQFKDVAPMFSRSCGSLDCHGSSYRNFRVYGYGGTRLGKPGPETPSTSDEEIRATYESAIGLEPEIMKEVVASGGRGVERLTLVRKARNLEDHKGKEPIRPGSEADDCLVSWLGSSDTPSADGGRAPIDVAKCRRSGCLKPGGADGVGADISPTFCGPP